ncbi:xanthine phosphoribosyltransferase [Starmerella bacillaris]|uniref:Xanthine phosphoribosyltransferase n=1 Tax=Starmerella bacillaris TaxID=1247836 RepID=A0AAV5RGP0_STABA|nr:xanthine phosphoribosyltransferase [Starmerella bacillaris]
MSEKIYVTYNDVHKLCQEGAKELEKFNPEVIIAIGGGGFIPARILRTFLKRSRGDRSKNIPIQAVGLSLYEDMGTDDYEEKIGKEIIRMQWLDFSALNEHKLDLIGKNILIVDEVDDTRTTLHYAVSELQKDLDALAEKLGRGDEKTTLLVFVLHNKDKPKNAELPADMMSSGRYVAACTTGDEWIAYPWEADNIDEHTRLGLAQKK